MANQDTEDPIDDIKARIRHVSVGDVMEMRARGKPVVFVDVREASEWNLCRVPGAIHIRRGTLESEIEAHVPRDAVVVVYCARGGRSAGAADALQRMGYSNVASIEGGIVEWYAAGGEVVG